MAISTVQQCQCSPLCFLELRTGSACPLVSATALDSPAMEIFMFGALVFSANSGPAHLHAQSRLFCPRQLELLPGRLLARGSITASELATIANSIPGARIILA